MGIYFTTGHIFSFFPGGEEANGHLPNAGGAQPEGHQIPGEPCEMLQRCFFSKMDYRKKVGTLILTSTRRPSSSFWFNLGPDASFCPPPPAFQNPNPRAVRTS